MAELYSNNFRTTLASPVAPGDLTVTLAATPPAGLTVAGGTWRLIVDSEILLVTAVSGAVCTVTRGAEGTSAASHSSGTFITHVWTAGALDQVRSDIQLTGLVANLPAAAKAGRVYRPTDAPMYFQDTGAAWLAFGPVWPVYPPVAGNFAASSNPLYSGTSVVSSNGCLALSAQHASRGLVYTPPATPYTATMHGLLTPVPTDITTYGMGWQANSGAVKFVSFTQKTTSGQFIYVGRSQYDATGAFINDTPNNSASHALMQYPTWLRVIDDGNNTAYQYSFDGFTYTTWLSETRLTFCNPDKVLLQLGSAVEPQYTAKLLVDSFQVTSP